MKRILNLMLVTTLLLSGCVLPGGAEGAPTATPETPVEPTAVLAPSTNTPEPLPTEAPTEAPTPEPTATTPPIGAIFGRVFHDVCANGDPSDEGCVEGAGDGRLTEGDEALSGVRVFLGEGTCPSFGRAESVTNAEGFYAFAELADGPYCVTVDPTANAGLVPVLLPGQFTIPRGGAATLLLTGGQQVGDINFGWDYENLPSVAKDCIDRVEVDEVLAYPDGWSLRANVEFARAWRLKNAGTCTWVEGYALVNGGGEAMTETTRIPLSAVVEPEGTIDIAVALTSPAEPGAHSGVWLLQNERGQNFGSGEQANVALTVSINVFSELLTTAALGQPTLVDTLDTDDRWNLFEDKNVALTLENGRITLLSKRTDGFDAWTVTASSLGDATIEAVFTTGPACDGYDRYGLIVRSPEINSGYFLGISCNGQYAIRQWTGKKWEVLAGWSPGVNINTGPNAINHLVVVMEGNKLSLFVNGQLQGSVTDNDAPIYGGGRFGPFIASQGTTGFTVYLEEVAYWAAP